MADLSAPEDTCPVAGPTSSAVGFAYQAASDHWTHAEQTRWTLLYNFLMAITILLLAWAAVAGADVQPAGVKRLVLLGLSLGGFGLSIVWFGLALRAGRFVHHYAAFGRAMESEQLKIEGPFRSAQTFGRGIKGIAAFAPSRVVLPLVPALFAALCLMLIYASMEIVRPRLSTLSQSVQTTRSRPQRWSAMPFQSQIDALFTAELQFRLASAVRLASSVGTQPLDLPVDWTHGKHLVR